MDIPSAQELRTLMRPMNYARIEQLAGQSGVPFHTLLKVRSGETANPGIETVRKFLPYLFKIPA